jgi:hypothetical protein
MNNEAYRRPHAPAKKTSRQKKQHKLQVSSSSSSPSQNRARGLVDCRRDHCWSDDHAQEIVEDDDDYGLINGIIGGRSSITQKRRPEAYATIYRRLLYFIKWRKAMGAFTLESLNRRLEHIPWYMDWRCTLAWSITSGRTQSTQEDQQYEKEMPLRKMSSSHCTGGIVSAVNVPCLQDGFS